MIEIPNKVKLLSEQKTLELIETSKDNTELFHPLCLRFPLISIEDLKALAIDIKINGLRDKIIKTIDIKDGKLKILDGRLRYLASVIADVEIQCEQRENLTEVEKIFLVISKNLQRRDLKLHEKIEIAYYLYKELKNYGTLKNQPL